MRISALITVYNRADLIRAVGNAPVGAQFDLVEDPRTTQQNRLMWYLLTDIADQVTHGGEKWDPEDWKCAFLKAMGIRCKIMPALDGDGVVATGYRSSKLDKAEFSELIELIYSEGAKRGVVFHGEAA